MLTHLTRTSTSMHMFGVINSKNKSKFYFFVGLALFAFGLLVPPIQVTAAPVCGSANIFNICVEITAVNPASPTNNQDFTVSGTVTASAMNAPGSVQLLLYKTPN